MRSTHAHPTPGTGQSQRTRSVTLIERETRTADRTLEAFARARQLAVQARGSGNTELAAELDDFAWKLVSAADPIRVSYAQQRLGLSNPTVRSWIERGILEHADDSPRQVTLKSLACLDEIVADLHRDRQGRDLTAAAERRLRWEEWRRSPAFESELERIRSRRRHQPRDHRTAELRSIAFHRHIAERLDRRMVEQARARVARWLRQGSVVPAVSAEEWRGLLERPLPEIKRLLVEDSDRMRDLRQNTPFAGALPERERMRLISEVH